MHKTHGGMGFKDLTAFNLAMIGKQGWKFMFEPNSLVSRIFKARYFPNNNYLNANLGHNPSYVWRSILKARFIVRGGARWCIGNGESIPILNEPWLVNGDRIEDNIVGAHFVSGFSVSSLIDHSSKTWNYDVIQQVFSPDIAVSIVRTPPVAQVAEDKLVWKAEKNGVYSIKSAYRICVEDIVDTSHLRRPGKWSDIWSLKCPPKIKNLIWRICRGCLPTRVRLQDKGVHCPLNCVSCEAGSEDLHHVFFNCPFAVQVWQRSGLWQVIQQALQHTVTAAEFMFQLLHNLPSDSKQRFVANIWSLLKHGNLKLWDDALETDAQVVDRAIRMLEDSKQLSCKH